MLFSGRNPEKEEEVRNHESIPFHAVFPYHEYEFGHEDKFGFRGYIYDIESGGKDAVLEVSAVRFKSTRDSSGNELASR